MHPTRAFSGYRASCPATSVQSCGSFLPVGHIHQPERPGPLAPPALPGFAATTGQSASVPRDRYSAPHGFCRLEFSLSPPPLAAVPRRHLIAVGTALTGSPPHRSQRALLTHWAPALGTNAKTYVGKGMHHVGGWQPSSREAVHPRPADPCALATALKRLMPELGHLGAETGNRHAIARHGVVSAVSPHYARQPPSLLRDRLVPTLPELVLDLSQLGPHPLRDRNAPNPETPVPPHRADVREAEEVERPGFPLAPRLPVRGGEPPELDQPRLARVQIQPELREPLAEIVQEPACILVILETHDEVVCETHDDDIPARNMTPPPVGPQVEDIMEVNVRQQWRRRCALRRTLRGLRPVPVLDDPCAQPLADQAQDPFIRDPVPEELLQPAMIKAGEKIADIRIEHPVHLLHPDPGRQRIQRIMRAAPWPEPIGEAQEVRLIDGIQHLDDGTLDDLVFQRGDAERPQPPVRLRDVRPPGRPCPVTACMQPPVQVLKVAIQVLAVGCPRHPVHARRGLGTDRPVGPPQPAQADVVQQRGEPRFLIPSCHLTHTVQPAWRTLPGTASGMRCAGRVLLGRSPFLHRLRNRSRGLVQRLRRYYGTV